MWGSGSTASILLTSAEDGDEKSTHATGWFTSGDRVDDTHWLRRWVSSRDGLGAVSEVGMGLNGSMNKLSKTM